MKRKLEIATKQSWFHNRAKFCKYLGCSLIVFSVFITGNGQSFDLVNEFDLPGVPKQSTGIAVADYDLDGDLDVFIVASLPFDKDNSDTWSRLLRNDGNQGFSDVTLTAGLINWQAETRDGTMGSKLGASWGDYDNDGYPDIFISNYGLDELWHNEGDGTFKDVTELAQVQGCLFCYSSNALWWDYDQDGDLDLYVSDWLKENRFFRNEGNHTFTDISVLTGLDDKRHTFSSLPIDLDEDGLLDLYIVNDIGENRFFWNKGEDNFREATAQVGLSNRGNGMGVDVCDFNNDGYFDIYVTNIHAYVPNPFFVNNGEKSFTDQARALGIDNTGWGWGTRFFDADHDLDEDLYVVNGFFSPVAERDKNKFFKNEAGIFTDISSELGVNSSGISMGLEVFDYDLDGDLDMLASNKGKGPNLFLNRTIETNPLSNWIQIKLEGTQSNRNGFGSIVKITCEGEDYYRYHSGVNLFGQSIKPVHFGLGNHTQIAKIQVNWPSGLQEVFENIPSNQILELKEGTGLEIRENMVPENLLIFPNPFTEQLWLHAPEDLSETFSFSLINMIGQKVLNQSLVIRSGEDRLISVPLDRNQGSGLYFYTIKGEETIYTGQLMKN